MGKSNNVAVPQVEDRKKDFKGYTIEELRYQKALAALRKEFCKSNVLNSIENIKHPVKSSSSGSKSLIPFLSSDKSGTKNHIVNAAGTVTKVVATSLLKGLKPLDYIMLGISLIGPAKRLIRLFRKKK